MHARTREYRFTGINWDMISTTSHRCIIGMSLSSIPIRDFMMKEQMKVSGNTEMSNLPR